MTVEKHSRRMLHLEGDLWDGSTGQQSLQIADNALPTSLHEVKQLSGDFAYIRRAKLVEEETVTVSHSTTLAVYA